MVAVTNVPEKMLENPRSWEFRNMDAADPAEKPQFAAGATEELPSGGVRQKQDIYPTVPRDPRLGANPQGEWDAGKMQQLFPEMFAQAPEAPWDQPGWEKLAPDERLAQLGTAEKKVGKVKEKFGITTGQTEMPGQQPLRMPSLDRNAFERVAFQQIRNATGISNPFMYDPYQEIIKADKELPELFNSYFKGHATWQDLPNLSKEQRAAWEDIKKQHHSRVYDAAKAKRDQAMNMYRWMMQKFDMEDKAETANYVRAERKRAADLARSGRGPTTRALLDPDTGQMTLHEYDSNTGEWVSTGKRTGLASLEDRLSPKAKFAMQFMRQFMPKMDSGQAMMIMLMQQSNPGLAKTLTDAMMPKITPELQKQLTAAQSFLAQELTQMFGPAFTPAAGEKGKVPAASQTANMENDLATIVQAAKTNHPNLRQAIAMFQKTYPGSDEMLAQALNKLGYKESPELKRTGKYPAEKTSKKEEKSSVSEQIWNVPGTP